MKQSTILRMLCITYHHQLNKSLYILYNHNRSELPENTLLNQQLSKTIINFKEKQTKIVGLLQYKMLRDQMNLKVRSLGVLLVQKNMETRGNNRKVEISILLGENKGERKRVDRRNIHFISKFKEGGNGNEPEPEPLFMMDKLTSKRTIRKFS